MTLAKLFHRGHVPSTVDCSFFTKVHYHTELYKILIREWIYRFWVLCIQGVTIDILFRHHNFIFWLFCTSCACLPQPSGAHTPGIQSLGWQLSHKQGTLSRAGKAVRHQRGKEVSKIWSVFITTQLVFKISISFQQICFLPLMELRTYVLPGRWFLQLLKLGLGKADSQFLPWHVWNLSGKLGARKSNGIFRWCFPLPFN